jgi:hypothetical protein
MRQGDYSINNNISTSSLKFDATKLKTHKMEPKSHKGNSSFSLEPESKGLE